MLRAEVYIHTSYETTACSPCLGVQLFEVGSDGDGYKGVLKKTCSLAASAPLSPTVLLVSCSGQCRDTNMWSSITQIMSEGTYSTQQHTTPSFISLTRHMQWPIQ